LLDPGSPPSATSTVDEARDAYAGVDSRLAARAQALGKANSFGSVFQDYGEALGRNAQDIDMNSTSMRNWNQRVLPIQLEAANNSGRQWGTAADVLKLAATVMAPMALGGGGAGNAASAAQQEIATARFGDLAGKSLGAFGGGTIPFGSATTAGAAAGLSGASAASLMQQLPNGVPNPWDLNAWLKRMKTMPLPFSLFPYREFTDRYPIPENPHMPTPTTPGPWQTGRF